MVSYIYIQPISQYPNQPERKQYGNKRSFGTTII